MNDFQIHDFGDVLGLLVLVALVVALVWAVLR